MDIDIDALVQKYMQMLAIQGLPPRIVIRNNLGARALGSCWWTSRAPETTTITLQRVVLANQRTLERVLAHEMIHHRDDRELTQADPARVRLALLRARANRHGESFHEGAALVNRLMGEGFVTETSDTTYEVAPNTRPFFVLIADCGGRLGWEWAARLSPAAKERCRTAQAEGARLVQTTDARLADGRARIRRYSGYTFPFPATEVEKLLQALWDEAAPK
jgi:hypothetical protein